MSPMSSPVAALFFSLFLIFSAADAFNITKILNAYSDFSTFNNYLNQTGVAEQINSKQTVTVLAVANDAMSAVSGLSQDALKKTLSVHVILDYYDAAKLQNLRAKTGTQLTTLYQQSGLAQNHQGFLNVTRSSSGTVVFRSAAPGSNQDSTFVKTISSQPYNISVLEISNVINVALNSTTPSSPPAPVPVASPPRKALAPAPSSKDSPAASPPNPSDANAPSTTVAGSPSDPVADGPAGSGNKSSTVSVTSGSYLLASILMIFSSSWFLLTMI
ncbi:hypothetical protein PTKIN_Ptkin13bG0091200 [Pterospermum kingtungense]